jgi:hypothetical protein
MKMAAQALPAFFGLSGIPGISGRERGVGRKSNPLSVGGSPFRPAAGSRTGREQLSSHDNMNG